MIKLNSVFKTYDNGKGKVKALDDVTIEIKKGEFIAITGRSGSGKSTLLYVIGMLENADSGEICVDGLDYNAICNKTKAEFRNKKIGFVYQNYNLENHYTAFENVETPLLIAGISKDKRIVAVDEKLNLVDMADRKNEIVKHLSGGEKQRIAIARALANNPEIILADEPCGNLDKKNSDIIMNIFKNLAKEGYTVLLVTHNLEDAMLADRILFMEDGRLIKKEESL